ncbi:MAG: response regulator transcription factor [Hyphomicrobium zavarzinii]|jgi:DNA-binding response OmpR family regulator|uniref:response regulator transcription factor n=1 Tax=Hyphomicrobium TaxID=81 RepID=UPI0003672E4C|nr:MULTISPECIES: response regulator transcription factor [Hyphomicrobium]MBL8846764.1 response regulator transcription factor [Hyphomicrobium zavarzinii]WBT39824.1 response regulator transcription factor [Hyphomicrobium sp. DMF-1]HML41905.1 response regulator transcription factor [Hyphomicrobium zavarzinii]
MRILLIEDEPLLGEAVATHLKKTHAVDWMQTLDDGAQAIETVSYDLMLLDLNLPDGHGLNFLRSIRKSGRPLPVIVITARDQIRDRIDGLNAGADDYVVKPFDLDELSARIFAVQRRASALPNPRQRIGAIEVDQAARKVWRDGEELQLTAREWALLDSFMHRLGTIVSKSKLEEVLYGFGSEIESNAVEVYVSRLRKKLGSNSIRTLRGLGYRMDR